MQPPHRWTFFDDTGAVDAWIARCSPTEAQLMQFYDFVFSTLVVNPLPFKRAMTHRISEVEHTATIPGTNITVSFFLLHDERRILLADVHTSED